jgi:oligopeptide transport system ATP-binding protein
MPYTMGLLRSVPRLITGDATGQRLKAIPGEVPNPLRLPRGCTFHPRCRFCVSGVCDSAVPELEECASGHWVRCARWREITQECMAS